MADWQTLEAELDTWNDAGTTATFWWRDDDATAASSELDLLATLATKNDIPVGLAVIPSLADDTLVGVLEATPQLTVLQHGLAHTNNAPENQKKAELGAHRPATDVLRDIQSGSQLLKDRFPSTLPVLVPPWNRISDAVVRELPAHGISGLSTFQPNGIAVRNLTIRNTHVDIIDWRGTRGFAGTSPTLAAICDHLRQRRLQTVNTDEPTGLLTHHLVHTPDCWHFMSELFRFTTEHPVAQWLSPGEIFASETAD